MLRRTRIRRKKKLGRPKPLTVDEQLDALARQIVMIRDGFECRRCHKGIKGDKESRLVLQVHHIRTKGAHPSLRWELDNLLLTCKACHFFGFHGRDSEATAEWYRTNLGQPFLDHLSLLARVRKGQKTDKAAVRIFLEATLENMNRQA